MKVTDKYTFFFRDLWISQWGMYDFHDSKGIKYSCTEQYMMSKKALLFDDAETNELIMMAEHPNEMKKLGRQVVGFDWDIWAANALPIVYQGNIFKFNQHPLLTAKLMLTKGTILVEASPYDKVWGIGMDENDPRCLDRATWQGTNWLGYTLTNVRDNYFNL